MSAIQPMRPHSLWERLCALFHTRPVERVPHWEHLRPPDLPHFAVEAEWAFIAAQLARLPLDDAHADAADRLVNDRYREYCAIVEHRQAERLELVRGYERQGSEHFVSLQERVAKLRWEREQHRRLAVACWEELSGAQAAAFEEIVVPRPIRSIAPAPELNLSLPETPSLPETVDEQSSHPGTPRSPAPTHLHPVRDEPDEPDEAVD